MSKVAEKIANAFVAPFVDAWIVMLLLGAAHTDYKGIPALGYWTTFALSYAVTCVAGTGARGAVLASE